MASTQPDPPLRELTRKLHWAVTSTLPHLSREQRTAVFEWAADIAERLMARPSASRSPKTHQMRPPPRPKAVDAGRANRYAQQAEGRGGGRIGVSSVKRRHQSSRAPLRVATPLPDFEAQKRAAIAYMRTGQAGERQLPIPPEVYREVGYGSTNSPSSPGGGGGESGGGAFST